MVMMNCQKNKSLIRSHLFRVLLLTRQPSIAKAAFLLIPIALKMQLAIMEFLAMALVQSISANPSYT